MVKYGTDVREPRAMFVMIIAVPCRLSDTPMNAPTNCNGAYKSAHLVTRTCQVFVYSEPDMIVMTIREALLTNEIVIVCTKRTTTMANKKFLMPILSKTKPTNGPTRLPKIAKRKAKEVGEMRGLLGVQLGC